MYMPRAALDFTHFRKSPLTFFHRIVLLFQAEQNAFGKLRRTVIGVGLRAYLTSSVL